VGVRQAPPDNLLDLDIGDPEQGEFFMGRGGQKLYLRFYDFAGLCLLIQLSGRG